MALDKITDTLIHLMAKAGLTLQQQHRRLAQFLLLSHFRHMSREASLGFSHSKDVRESSWNPQVAAGPEGLMPAHR